MSTMNFTLIWQQNQILKDLKTDILLNGLWKYSHSKSQRLVHLFWLQSFYVKWMGIILYHSPLSDWQRWSKTATVFGEKKLEKFSYKA